MRHRPSFTVCSCEVVCLLLCAIDHVVTVASLRRRVAASFRQACAIASFRRRVVSRLRHCAVVLLGLPSNTTDVNGMGRARRVVAPVGHRCAVALLRCWLYVVAVACKEAVGRGWMSAESEDGGRRGAYLVGLPLPGLPFHFLHPSCIIVVRERAE
jgi:hypothetical protein